MKPREGAEKASIKLRYAVAFEKALSQSRFRSFRDLALHLGFEPAHVQRLAAGKVDAALSTSIALAEGLGLTYSKFAAYYDAVTEKDITDFLQRQESRKRTTPSKKTVIKKKKK